MPSVAPPRVCTDEDYQIQAGLLKALTRVPAHDAAGVCLSYLLVLATQQPQLLRRLLNERVVENGFSHESMLSVLQRAAR